MQPKTLGELIADCRDELDDEVEPYLVSDEKLTKYLNEAVEEACVRSRALVESNNAAVCDVVLVPGQAEYNLHPAVVVVRRAILDGDPDGPLCRTTSAALDSRRSDWRDDHGKPEYLVRDHNARTILLSPVPEVAGTLKLTVWRTPTEDELLEDESDEPVIDQNYHAHLFRWACFRVLNKREVEQNSTSDADRNLQMFEQAYGPRPSARELQQLSIDRLTGVAAAYF